MKQLKHYRELIVLKILNIIFEYGLLVASLYISAALRRLVPANLATFFAFRDVHMFVYPACICDVVNIVIYFMLGDYSTIHFRRLRDEMMRVFLVQLASGFTLAAYLYWSQGQQFSRVWMVIYIAVSFVIILSKRALIHYGADGFLNQYLLKDRLILAGGGDLAIRFVKGSQGRKDYRFDTVGYLADRENETLSRLFKEPITACGNGIRPDHVRHKPWFIEERDQGREKDGFGYLGNVKDLNEVLKKLGNISMLVITEDTIDRTQIREILNICGVYDIRAYVIASFNDYLVGRLSDSFREDIPGLYMFPLNNMETDNILGVNIAVTNMKKTLEDISGHLDEWKGEYICVSNVHTTVMAFDDPKYREVQNNAVLSLPDGGPLSTHSKNEGNETAGRVTGPDLMREILTMSGEKGWSHFFYGSTQKTLDALERTIKERYPGARIAGMISPPFRPLSPEEDYEYVEQINRSKPDFLWVGLGAPKQEIWMAAHRGRVNALMIGVGAAFDYESGNIKRAPVWMQKANLEWFYRLLQDPKRLFKRYFVTNFKYLWLTRK